MKGDEGRPYILKGLVSICWLVLSLWLDFHYNAVLFFFGIVKLKIAHFYFNYVFFWNNLKR